MAERRRRALGPLVVSQTNPRYFTVASDAAGEAVYLAGSHIWNNLQDGLGPGEACSDEPERMDFDEYLDLLEERGHNFIRLWRWEQFRSYTAVADYHLCMSPQPWARTGPGEASDGKPKFDLYRFDDEYFRRLRDRVTAAGERGIYVAVMLFEGWGLHLSTIPLNVEGHPFHATNNVNGVAIDSIMDHQVLPLAPSVQDLQEAYVHHVIDTLHDLPNVLWEVANESSGGGDGRSRVREVPRPGSRARVGELHGLAVLGDRHREALRRGEGLPVASHRDDDAVPGGRPDQGERAAVRRPRRMDLARFRGAGLRPGQPRAPGVVRRPARRGRTEGRDRRHGPHRTGRRRRALGVEDVPAWATIRS